MAEELRILVLKDGDMLLAQCLEYDVCVQAPTFAELLRRMDALLEMEARAGFNVVGKDFGDIGPAPDEFHKMWDSAMAFEDAGPGRKMAMAA